MGPNAKATRDGHVIMPSRRPSIVKTSPNSNNTMSKGKGDGKAILSTGLDDQCALN